LNWAGRRYRLGAGDDFDVAADADARVETRVQEALEGGSVHA
jgi:hypothetical protein